jgi:hypothetical protein
MAWVTVLGLLALPAAAASVSGRVTSGGAPLTGMEVRLWAQTPKGYSFAPPGGRTVLTDGAGNYTFTGVPAGTYKLDTRMSSALAGNYGDRWLDVQPPTANGYVQADADELVLADADARTGVNLDVEVLGGVDLRVVAGGGLGGLFGRLESVADARVHHNDTSKTTPAAHLGELSYRGLPPGPMRLVLHDVNYVRADVLGPTYTIASGSTQMGGDVTVGLAPADPNEPNNSAGAGTMLDVSPLRLTPRQVVTVSGAIGPRNGDVDFFCWSAQADDRYLLSAVGTLGTWPDGGVRESPWVDPVVSFWRSGSRSGEDDDSGPLGRDARLDTGAVGAGAVCAAVTTFGDTGWTGQNQQSAGPYRLSIELGNRPPAVTTTVGGQPTPAPPLTVPVDEGQVVTVTATFADLDGDALMASWELRDSSSTTVTAGSLNPSAGPGTVSWTPSQVAARRSPYTLTVTVADAEFTRTATVVLEVRAANLPPSTPDLVSPDAGVVLTSSTPTLACRESSDPDVESLVYEFELTLADAGTPTQTGRVAGIDGGVDPDGGVFGVVAFTAASLPENAQVTWRVRAFDGHPANGYSPWSEAWRFVVDTVNEPPMVPYISKPGDAETVLVQRPTLEVVNPLEPEGEAVSFVFEVSRDLGFSQVVLISQPVPAAPGASTMWTVTQDLDWGARYWVRAFAVDARGARSGASNVVGFGIRENQPPMTPVPGEPFSMGRCTAQVFTEAPTFLEVPALNDLEQDAVVVEVQVARFDDTAYAQALFSKEAPASATAVTRVALEGVSFEEDGQYRVRLRAKDGSSATPWVECTFTLDGRSGAGGGPAMVTTKSGCGCGEVEWGGLVALASWLARRRTRTNCRRGGLPATRS